MRSSYLPVRAGMNKAKTAVNPVSIAMGFLPMESSSMPTKGSSAMQGMEDKLATVPMSAML